MHLTQGTTYAADIDVGWPASMVASASMVQDRFAGLGFTGIETHDLGGGKFHLQGVWGKPDQDVNVPSQVTNIVTISAPGQPPHPDDAQAALDMAAAQAAAPVYKAAQAADQAGKRSSGVPWPLLVLGLVLLGGRR